MPGSVICILAMLILLVFVAILYILIGCRLRDIDINLAKTMLPMNPDNIYLNRVLKLKMKANPEVLVCSPLSGEKGVYYRIDSCCTTARSGRCVEKSIEEPKSIKFSYGSKDVYVNIESKYLKKYIKIFKKYYYDSKTEEYTSVKQSTVWTKEEFIIFPGQEIEIFGYVEAVKLMPDGRSMEVYLEPPTKDNTLLDNIKEFFVDVYKRIFEGKVSLSYISNLSPKEFERREYIHLN